MNDETIEELEKLREHLLDLRPLAYEALLEGIIHGYEAACDYIRDRLKYGKE